MRTTSRSPFAEVRRRAEKDDIYDYLTDDRLMKAAAASRGGFVLGSRLSVWIAPEYDLSVWLEASPEVRAQRISKRENRLYGEVLAETIGRDRDDLARYVRLYGIDMLDHNFVDLDLNAGEMDAEEVAARIIETARSEGRLRENPRHAPVYEHILAILGPGKY